VASKKEEGVVEVFKELGLYDPASSGIYVVYGAPAVGKTTLVARLLEGLARDEVPAFYAAAEPNLLLYGQLDAIRRLLPQRARCGGRELEAVRYVDAPLPLLHFVVEVTTACERAVMAVDSITALALHEQARYLAATGRLDQLYVIRQISAFGNALAQLAAANMVSRHVTLYLVAQERPAIGQPYYGEPAAPSFAMRAQHNVAATARLTAVAAKRTLKVVWHRVSRYAGQTREIELEPLV